MSVYAYLSNDRRRRKRRLLAAALLAASGPLVDAATSLSWARPGPLPADQPAARDDSDTLAAVAPAS